MCVNAGVSIVHRCIDLSVLPVVFNLQQNLWSPANCLFIVCTYMSYGQKAMVNWVLLFLYSSRTA